MNDPNATQAAALAAVDRLIQLEHRSAEMVGCVHPHLDAISLEGRRRILERHGPEFCDAGEHWVCAAHDRHIPWEDCPDWLDAAAGLPLTQDRTEE